MQLSNASVDSLADGVLTLSFAQAGTAKGFLSGGYDQVLSEVLAEMFGVTPTITTSVGTAVGPGRSEEPVRSAEPPSTGRASNDRSETAASATRPAGPARRDGARPPQQQATGRGAARRPPSAAENEPEPSDLPAPDALTGTDLIEQELGGRIIEELGGP
jgi:hypothetical protein